MLIRAASLLVLAIQFPLAFAGLPGQDKNVDALRVLMRNARVPTQADMQRLEGAPLSCKSVEAIPGDSTFGESVAPQFVVRGRVIMDVNPNAFYPHKVFEITTRGLSWEMPDGKFLWRIIYRITTDGRLIGEVSLSPQGGYEQGQSVVDSRFFAKIYEICSL